MATSTTHVSFENTIICQDCVVGDNVTIGKGTVLHPRATIISKNGAPIIIGDNNIIEELVTITNTSDQPMTIGSRNLFEVGSVIEAKSIGNDNVVETKAKVSAGTVIDNGCVVGACCITPENEHLKDCEGLYGPTLARTKSTIPRDMHNSTHDRHLELLHKTLPNFHQMKR
ncbi:hypothetical protein SAMD00019534_111100 [Acytostelium subglobosum LB1]|uniref:hypothetical protein n=1 Tax=Acytostelium subglobosum LB1 TaxID=1410327 RepID=UPI000644E62D|nr:hypothetical protein SAMD00019534_111100 [Acytostelium subglobosum LB1]GAM27934.1 hypothetical protein SAMD00019534_111100 [Acytostelium subglobosum LB1]|eukprot:XP_012749217.1 hypothetical protein SAMD00019534_111100 [Acytostelium subglobosum LB1]